MPDVLPCVSHYIVSLEHICKTHVLRIVSQANLQAILQAILCKSAILEFEINKVLSEIRV